MAKIIINKGFISHGGRLYKAGEIVTISDANAAKRIVARSGGDFDFYHGQEIPAADEGDAKTTSGANPGAGADDEGEDGAGGVSESDNGGDGEGLPALDPAAAMQTSKTAKGKKK